MSNNAEVSSKAPQAFDLDATVWQIGQSTILSCRFPELTMERSARLVRTLDSDRYLLRINRSSEIAVDTDGKRLVAKPGQVLLMDASRPETILTSPGPHMTLSIPRAQVDQVLPGGFDLNGILLEGAVAEMLGSHLMQMENHLAHLTPIEAEGAITAAAHLLGASLAPSVKSLGMARPSIEQSLLRQARTLVERNLQSSELGVELLCKELRISRSALYRLFTPLGGIAAYVRERRLARIHALLSARDAQSGRNYLGRIADEYGFTSASHFSRVFREQFGYSPRDARSMASVPVARQPGSSGHGGQLGRYGSWDFTVPGPA